MLTFLRPEYLGLLLVALLGILYAYQKFGKLPKEIVASAFLLSQLRKRVVAKQKFRFPWRALVDLLLLSILILIIAGLSRQGSGEKVLVLIDNSLSTTAKNGVNTTVFTDNLEHLRTDLKNSSVSAKYKLCLTSPALNCLSEEYQSKNLINLDNLKNYNSADNISSAVSYLISNENPNRFIVLSDHNQGAVSSDRIKLISSRKAPQDNMVIRSVQKLSREEHLVTLLSYSNSPVAGELNYFYRKDDAWQNAVIPFEVKARQTLSVPFKFSGDLAVMYLDLDPAVDALQEDSVYWYQPHTEQKRFIVWQKDSSDLKLSEVLKNETIIYQNYSSYSGFKPLLNDIYIFNKVIPDLPPQQSSLFVAGSVNQQVTLGFLKGKLISKAEISYWNKASPLLKYLNPAALSFNTASVGIKTPAWLEGEIKHQDFALLAHGYREKNTYVYVGVPLFPYLGKENKPLSVLALNILNHLQSAKEKQVELSGETLIYYLDNNLQIVKAQNQSVGLHNSAEESASGKLLVHNFFDQQESNLLEIPRLDIYEDFDQSIEQDYSNSYQNSLLILLLSGLLIYYFFYAKKD